jgi:hypothetical protein
MLHKIIPGHVRAYSLWICLLLSGIAYAVTHSAFSTLGVALVVLGIFLGDQATHLAQENHQGVQPTWIEGQMQKHRWVFVFLGTFVAVIGLLCLLK